MRKELKQINGQRMGFTGVFARYGHKNGYKGPIRTLLFTDVRRVDTGKIITDHVWFTITKGFEALQGELVEGSTVSFNARVSKYEKGYKGYREDVYAPVEYDYRLSYPTKIKLSKQEI